MDRFFTQVPIQNLKSLKSLKSDEKMSNFLRKNSLKLLNPFKIIQKMDFFRKSALACPKIVGSGHPAPRSKVLECAVNLRYWLTRSYADRPSYSSAKVY